MCLGTNAKFKDKCGEHFKSGLTYQTASRTQELPYSNSRQPLHSRSQTKPLGLNTRESHKLSYNDLSCNESFITDPQQWSSATDISTTNLATPTQRPVRFTDHPQSPANKQSIYIMPESRDYKVTEEYQGSLKTKWPSHGTARQQ
jgi:hypothetical protein